ncbi:MAG: hypothetical protein K2Y09_00250 [Nitrosomonas sp.]|jgi:hypothetical protein|uniref:hypothetical protein n=1 Tax=Nitrosomonas sp. TaxID=42353 RepID=UPI001D97795C|nr:hypothetical protein [Nitrosomonas sp.]MBX9893599.1 hypothetical protein [Nitrosomonas sp.]
MRTIPVIVICFAAFALSTVNNAMAGPDVSEIQRQFNAETVNKRFSVPTDAALNSALKEATQRGMPSARTQRFTPGCIGLGCGGLGYGNFGYGSYFGGYARPYYGGLYGVSSYAPYYYGW